MSQIEDLPKISDDEAIAMISEDDIYPLLSLLNLKITWSEDNQNGRISLFDKLLYLKIEDCLYQPSKSNTGASYYIALKIDDPKLINYFDVLDDIFRKEVPNYNPIHDYWYSGKPRKVLVRVPIDKNKGLKMNMKNNGFYINYKNNPTYTIDDFKTIHQNPSHRRASFDLWIASIDNVNHFHQWGIVIKNF